MADILNVVFRSFMSQSDQTRALTPSVPLSSSDSSSSVLILGDSSVISHSLLLLTAVTAAAQLGIRVMFFTQTHIRRLPTCVPGLSPESLKKIQFCYPRTVEELLQQIASLHESAHLSPAPPSLIIVDRLENFLCAPGSHSDFHSGEQSCAAHLSALLCDTAAFLTRVLEQRSSDGGPCRIMTSFQSEADAGQSGQESSVLDVLDRYFQVRCTLDQSRGCEAATATARRQVWNIYLSGRGIAETTRPTDAFSLDTCRLMIAMLDRDMSGSMGFPEFKELWQVLNGWKNTFASYDRDRSGTMEAQELQQAIVTMGYHLSPNALNGIIRRHSVNGRIPFDEFIGCSVRLRCLTDHFQRRDTSRSGHASFQYDDFIQVTMSV